MKKILFAIFLALTAMPIMAQNPGYLGRHFILSVDGVISPSRRLMHEIAIEPSFDISPNSSFPVVIGPSAGLEYILNEGHALSLEYTPKFRTVSLGAITAYSENEGTLRKITINEFCLLYKNYFSVMAPIGAYYGLGLSYNMTIGDDSGLSMPFHFPVHNLGIAIEVGRRHILYNFLDIHYSIRYGALVLGYNNAMGVAFPKWNRETISFNTFTPDEQFAHRLNGDIWSSQLLVFKLGIGFIPKLK